MGEQSKVSKGQIAKAETLDRLVLKICESGNSRLETV